MLRDGLFSFGLNAHISFDFPSFNSTSEICTSKRNPQNSLDVKKAFLVGTHSDSFRPGAVAEIIGVVFFAPPGLEVRPCYHVRFGDGKEDLVPIADTGNFRIISEDEVEET